jgi:uncharacterized heparinase superfamily protein
MGCFVPSPIASSTAEAECNTQKITCMKVSYIKQMDMDIRYANPSQPYTVALLANSTASIAITQSARDAGCIRHIDWWWFYVRQSQA